MNKKIKIIMLFLITVGLIYGNYVLKGEFYIYDNILLIALSIYIFFMAFTLLFLLSDGIFYSKASDTGNINQSEIDKAYSTAKSWKMLNFVWLSVSWTLTALPILLSILVIFVASYEVYDGSQKIIQYTVISLAMTAIASILRPKEIAYGFHVAFEKLNEKLLFFSCGECEWVEVLYAIKYGEEIIRNTTYDTINVESQGTEKPIKKQIYPKKDRHKRK